MRSTSVYQLALLAGPYPQPCSDCESAIELDFLREIVNFPAAYVGLDRDAAGGAEDAGEVG